MCFLRGVLFLQLDLDLISSRQFLFPLDWLNAIILEYAALCEYDLAHVGDHPFLDLHVDLQLNILKF